MIKLQVVTLATRDPIEPGAVRYYIPSHPGRDHGDTGYVIIMEPVTPDILGAEGDGAYGTLRVMTEWGSRLIRTSEIGVLVTLSVSD